jgi:hypothetical protein
MFLRLACAVILVSAAVTGATAEPAQQVQAYSPIVIDDNVRVFTTVAALNVAGFDVELSSQYHPARAEVRKLATTLDPDLVQRLKAFYNTHKSGEADENQLAKYISLAVLLGDPPEFKLTTREEGLPDDVRSVLDFVPLLREFYQKAGVTRLWARVGPAYEAEMDRIGPLIRDAIAKTDSYIRASSGGFSVQTMRISVELAAPQNSVNVRSDREDYYVVLGYAATPRVEEIRHAYLHVRLNSYLAAAVAKVVNGDSLLGLLSGVEGVPRAYATNFETMLTESFVRAIELRMDREPPARAQESLRNLYRSGLLLAPYFYDALIAYESSDSSLRSEIATIAGAVDVGKERTRFQDTFHTITLPERQPLRAEVPTAPKGDPVLDLLRSAQAVFDKDKPRAREAFEKVLKDYDANNGRALYGIGLIEMDNANRAASDTERDATLSAALGYFERTIASTSADRSMKTWSHIYAGHILDFKCNRSAATDHYKKAIESGDDTRDAQKTAQRDLAQPFGGECQQ